MLHKTTGRVRYANSDANDTVTAHSKQFRDIPPGAHGSCYLFILFGILRLTLRLLLRNCDTVVMSISESPRHDPALYYKDLAVNPNLVPAFSAGSHTVLDFDPGHAFDSNLGPALSGVRPFYPNVRPNWLVCPAIRFGDLATLRADACLHHRHITFMHNLPVGKSQSNEDSDSEKERRVPPHCHITIKCTREIAGFNGLSEAVRRLDFSSAVRDTRRFNYICALLQLLLGGQRLTRLPGAAQKLLLSMLEEVANHVASSKQNLNALRTLLVALSALRETERRACWGRPLGSRALWGRHDTAIARIHNIAQQIDIPEPGPEVVPKLHDLPEECIREIILRIADHRDLDAASAAWSVMSSLCSEQRVWRELVQFHFTPTQLDSILTKLREEKVRRGQPEDDQLDWKAAYHMLRKTYGLREDAQYAETLSLCRHCKCLFWRSLGHPCIADQCPEYRERLREAGGPLPPHPVPPAAFLKFFSL
ncbi:F-box only protein 25 [Eumeta japonica]|uniref:F-box only protein 25 n=1 Tax=Eumeta variegata TaxID=151549 RepID=A0A4C1TZA5_EUMVA|nr:F-box only protein 25 [Eumeta japonica]